jgi:hypothetical protein
LTDWDAIIANARRPWDKDEIKRELPIEWVLSKYGVLLDSGLDGRLTGPCPFHQDDNPSFAVWWDDEGRQWVGCWSCDFRVGDVLDLIGRWHGEQDFRRVGEIAAELLADFRADVDWAPTPREHPTSVRADPADLIAQATGAVGFLSGQGRPNAADVLCAEKGWHFDGDFLAAEWAVGAEDAYTVVIPHWRHDGAGGVTLTGLKTRTSRSHTIARAGSDLSALYGEWRDHGRETVVLCEGESDSWTADWAVRRAGLDWDVVGLPSGVSAAPRPEWLERLRARTVIVAFDGDNPGRMGAMRWALALHGRAEEVRVATLPDGADLSALDDPLAALLGATVPPPNPGAVAEQDGMYVRIGGQGPVPVTNWVANPTRALTSDQGRLVFEVSLPGGRSEVITADDLRTEATAREWAKRFDGNFRGTTRDAQDILGMFTSIAPYLSQGRATSVVGWHDGAFVWPGGTIAPAHQHWRYLPPMNGIADLPAMLEGFREDADCDPAGTVGALLGLRSPAVMSPVLAWVALSPLRALFDRFPPLTITGSAGAGKTAMVEAVLDAFGWGITANLTATTPHAVHSFAGSTNGVPVWFDEYRNAAREDAKTALEQVLRDAWAGQASYKGGMQQGNWAALTALPATAPMIVTGEDAFTETSHAERLIQVFLSRDDRDIEGLRRLRAARSAGFGHLYVSWLVDAHARGELPFRVPDVTQGRVEYNLECLEVGWSVLEGFTAEVCRLALPEPDWSQVRANVRAAAAHDPYLEVVRWGLTQQDGASMLCQRVQDGATAVRVASLYSAATRSRAFKLPGGARAMERHLVDALGGVAQEVPGIGPCVLVRLA